MKTNLKTFPIWNVDDHLFIEKMQKWKLDFEAELRQIQTNLDSIKSPFTVMSLTDFQRLLLEVLGETT